MALHVRFWIWGDGLAAQSHGENRGSDSQRTQLLGQRGAGGELRGGPVSRKLYLLKPSLQSWGIDKKTASIFVPWSDKIPGKPAEANQGS